MSSIKIKDFYNGRFLAIPKYQRGYAWERKHIADLFADIKESIESKSNHYIGTIVLSKDETDDELFYIVDGQQRITSISLIISRLIKALKKEDCRYYKRFYIKENNRYRLLPLGRDKLFFYSILDNKNQLLKPENKSQRYLKEAIDEIDNNIDLIPNKLDFLKSIEKLEIMEFIENTEGDAIRIFQTVNDRGKPLSNMEKAKSLLIYFSNRYLNKELDNQINNAFSTIFELYDDIKQTGEENNITLIKNKEFNEDNIMRYHFISYTNENYDPTASYVLDFLKNKLSQFRFNKDFESMYTFINNYVIDIKLFFKSMKNIMDRVCIESKYYKIFCILNLSATLYPLIVKLESVKLLDSTLPSDNLSDYIFLDLIELIDVRVYKTRGTDPKADIGNFVSLITKRKSIKEIEGWMIWFNQKWMSKDAFRNCLSDDIYGNRALNLIFIDYCEHREHRLYSIEDLKRIVSKNPNIEHILSQTPKFKVRHFGFKNMEEFYYYENTIGNLTILEKSLNSSIQNKNPKEKIDAYRKSIFRMTNILATEINHSEFTKKEILERISEFQDYLSKRWWC